MTASSYFATHNNNSLERVGQGEVDGCTQWVQTTWLYLGLAVKSLSFSACLCSTHFVDVSHL